MRYDKNLQKIFEIQHKIGGIHPFLEKVFPTAVIENDQFLIFDVDSSGGRYVFVKYAPAPIPVPEGVRAAFPLECHGNKIACVISGEAFNSLEGYVAIFHEFMHCNQWEICEPKLKQNLGIARKAVVKKDHMWELNHPFQYKDSEFAETYCLFLRALEKNELKDIFSCRGKLRQILNRDDFEYMVWQEWKEGFARFIENQIRNKLGLKENHNGGERPFDRVTFYEGGARFIEFLIGQRPELSVKIESLFYVMLSINRLPIKGSRHGK